MKKAILVFVPVLLLWLGATAWIGARVAPEAEHYAAWLSERYAPPGYRFEANVTGGGVTRSTVRLALTDAVGAAKHSPVPAVTAEVTHGPVWFSGGAGAGLARIETEQSYRDYRDILQQNRFMIEPEDGKISTTARIGFDGRVHAEGRADGFVLKEIRGATQVAVAPVRFSGVWEPYTLVGDYQVHTALVKGSKGPGEPLFAIEGLQSTAHIDARLSHWVYTGGGSVQAARIRLHDGQGNAMEAVPRLAFAIAEEANGTVGITYRADLNVSPGGQLPLRALHTEMTLHGVARDGLDTLLAKIRQWQREQVRLEQALTAATHDPEALSKAMIAMQEWQKEVMSQGQAVMVAMLVPGQTALQLRWRIETEHARENDLNATVRLLGPLPKGEPVMVLNRLVTQYPRYFGLDISATFGTRLFEDLGSTGQLYATWVALARSQGYLNCTNGQCGTTVHYRPDALTINGRSMPKLLLMIKMMSLGGFFQ